MAITDHYKPYTYDDEGGPGCGVAGHGDDCLCDVDQAKVDARKDLPYSVSPLAKLALRYAEQRQGYSGVTLENWFGELAGLMDELESRGKVENLSVRAEDARSRLLLKIQNPRPNKDGKGCNRYAWQPEVIELLRMGLTIEGVAAYVGVFVEDIARCLNSGNVRVAPYLRAEQLLRAGAESLGTVAKATGLSKDVVRNLAEAIGVDTKVKQNLDAGGGYKYTAEQYEAVCRLRAQGLSFAKIEAATGVERSRAFRVWRKRAA